MWKIAKQFLMAGKKKVPYCPKCDRQFKRDEKKLKCPKCGTKLTGLSVAKENAFYYRLYERYKSEEIEKCKRKGLRIVPSAKLPTRGGKKYEPDGVISTGHLDNRAKFRLKKTFLLHLWLVWREMEGLPTGLAYPEKLGHKIILPPNWPLKAAVK